ncbi:MAG: RHS repeat-associated core domain-containing protein [Verrucomicrobia bacterium]|nr:RHS repeat-associated core domain-containing protein [Verrucomicrobiota bacterium]
MRYYGYRYYSPTLSRFVNRDPIGEAAGPGLYTFVGNSPLDRIDHLGLCGVTLRRYVGRAGHQWIHYGTTNNVGFYPPGQWVDENELCRRIPNRPDPDNPDNYYEWETVQSDKGKLPDGTPCKCATCDQIEACLRSQTTGDPDPPGFSGLFGNCRKRSGQAIGSCCLKRGKMTHKPPSGQGAPSRCTGDSVGGSSWICGS